MTIFYMLLCTGDKKRHKNSKGGHFNILGRISKFPLLSLFISCLLICFILLVFFLFIFRPVFDVHIGIRLYPDSGCVGLHLGESTLYQGFFYFHGMNSRSERNNPICCTTSFGNLHIVSFSLT